MDSDDTIDDSGLNLMHQTNDKIRIRENSKGSQHDPEFENANLEAPYCPILAVNFIKSTLLFVREKIYSKVIQGSWPCCSFSPLDINCPKQRRIFNPCDRVDL